MKERLGLKERLGHTAFAIVILVVAGSVGWAISRPLNADYTQVSRTFLRRLYPTREFNVVCTNHVPGQCSATDRSNPGSPLAFVCSRNQCYMAPQMRECLIP